MLTIQPTIERWWYEDWGKDAAKKTPASWVLHLHTLYRDMRKGACHLSIDQIVLLAFAG